MSTVIAGYFGIVLTRVTPPSFLVTRHGRSIPTSPRRPLECAGREPRLGTIVKLARALKIRPGDRLDGIG
jgi:hypothetical protein